MLVFSPSLNRQFLENCEIWDNVGPVISWWAKFMIIPGPFLREGHIVSWGWFSVKMSSFRYRKSHYGDKTFLRPSYLYNGISYPGKIRSACCTWISATHYCRRMQIVYLDIVHLGDISLPWKGSPSVVALCERGNVNRPWLLYWVILSHYPVFCVIQKAI